LTSKGDQPAIDVAKCAQANNCLASPVTYPFEDCMSKKCKSVFSECVHDEECRAELRHCSNF
jgi:hypothetical protein